MFVDAAVVCVASKKTESGATPVIRDGTKEVVMELVGGGGGDGTATVQA